MVSSAPDRQARPGKSRLSRGRSRAYPQLSMSWLTPGKRTGPHHQHRPPKTLRSHRLARIGRSYGGLATVARAMTDRAVARDRARPDHRGRPVAGIARERAPRSAEL